MAKSTNFFDVVGDFSTRRGQRELADLQAQIEQLQGQLDDARPGATDIAMDQPPDRAGWYRVRQGLWRNRLTGETWRGWREYGARAGHYPGADWARSTARQARAAERDYAAQLRQVGRQISQMIRGVFRPEDLNDPGWDTVLDMLQRYRDMLRPWAQAAAWRMLADVSRRDAASWHRLGRQIGQGLREEIARAPVQDALQQLYDYQVEQILNIPDDAADYIRRSRERSAEIVEQMRGPAEEARVAGRRWEDLVKEISDTGRYQSTPETVARTETARAATTLQAVRAKTIGAQMFQWMTANDLTVRPLHQQLAKRDVGFGPGIYRYDDLPLLDDGRPGLPGSIYNCRCFQLPILPALD
jgi:SPP1 gp7 family putative phage head morphogenesis protein